MTKVKASVCGMGILAVATLLIMGCSGAGGTAPSKTDVGNAFAAMSVAQSAAPKPTGAGSYTLGSGAVTVAYNCFGDPTTGPATINGTITFTNYHDPSSGYTFTGTLTISESTNAAISAPSVTIAATITCNLAMAGGPISSLTCSLGESITISGSVMTAYTVTGTVTANGYTYNVQQL
jgi:hypothetical protein